MLFSFLAEEILVIKKLNIIFTSSSLHSVTTLATRVTGTALLLRYLFFLFSTYYMATAYAQQDVGIRWFQGILDFLLRET